MSKNTLACGAALTALAALIFTFSPGGASAQQAEHSGFFGEVTSVEADAMEVLLKDGETIRIRVDTADPKVVQGAANEDPSTAASGVDLTDLFEVGSRIAALVEMRDDEWWAVPHFVMLNVVINLAAGLLSAGQARHRLVNDGIQIYNLRCAP